MKKLYVLTHFIANLSASPFNIWPDGDSRGNILYGSQHNCSGPPCGYHEYAMQSGGLHDIHVPVSD